MTLKQLGFSFFTCGVAIVSGAGLAEAATLTTIVDGLSNPRGLSFGPDGSLYVSEPGIGGNGNCQPSPSTLFQPICAGNTGSYLKISPDGQQQRLFSNFQSLAEQPSGNQGAGLQDLQFDSQGNAYVLTGFAGYPGNRDLEALTLGSQYPIPDAQLATFPPSSPDEVLNTPQLARLFEANLETEELNRIFDFGTYEIVNNPDGQDVVTNPYDLTVDGDMAYVTDGGGNVAYKVKLDGSEVEAIPLPKLIVDSSEIFLPPPPPGSELPEGLIEILPPEPGSEGVPPVASAADATPSQNPFPPGSRLALQSVPTGNTIGPDGALYVGEYVGFPYPDNKARIFRIGEDNVPEVFAEGFNHITDLLFDDNGNLLVLQFSDISQLTGDLRFLPGSLIEVTPDGTRTTLVEAGEGLESAAGIAIGPDGDIYITSRAVGPNLGSVIRVDRDTEDTQSVPEPTAALGLLVAGALGATGLKRKHKAAQHTAH